jgi:glycosyltransferase involved in cell wall biosynthesis
MNDRTGVTVVLPCLNEETSIADVVYAARRGMETLGVPGEVLVVDNGSTDESVSRAQAAGATVIHEDRRGYGAAIRRGFQSAQYPILAMADGDRTYDLTKLPDIVRPILSGKADFVLGNRLNGVHPRAMPFLHRHVGNPMLSRLMRLMFHRSDIQDAHSGFRAIRRDAYKRLGCITTGMEFASEMLIRAIYEGLRIVFRDIEYHPRSGESKLRTFRDGWRHLRFMLLHSPSMVFLFPALVLWIVSLLGAVLLTIGPVDIASRRFDIHFLLALGALNVISMQGISIGILAKAFAHLSGIRHDQVIAWLYERLSFEAGIVISGVLMLVGSALGLHVFVRWARAGFGELDMVRRFFFSAICMVNGIQVGASSYLFSVMALPRRLDREDIATADTAIRDVP